MVVTFRVEIKVWCIAHAYYYFNACWANTTDMSGQGAKARCKTTGSYKVKSIRCKSAGSCMLGKDGQVWARCKSAGSYKVKRGWCKSAGDGHVWAWCKSAGL